MILFANSIRIACNFSLLVFSCFFDPSLLNPILRNTTRCQFQNYIPELLREDIPQALRGQRNVIFGNVEKIYEFHSQYFLRELEKCENSPLLIGQSFLTHVSVSSRL